MTSCSSASFLSVTLVGSDCSFAVARADAAFLALRCRPGCAPFASARVAFAV